MQQAVDQIETAIWLNEVAYKDKKKLGTITISKGSIECYPKNAKDAYSFSWSEFDKMINEYYTV